jgi:hypothetical protein
VTVRSSSGLRIEGRRTEGPGVADIEALSIDLAASRMGIGATGQALTPFAPLPGSTMLTKHRVQGRMGFRQEYGTGPETPMNDPDANGASVCTAFLSLEQNSIQSNRILL